MFDTGWIHGNLQVFMNILWKKKAKIWKSTIYKMTNILNFEENLYKKFDEIIKDYYTQYVKI